MAQCNSYIRDLKVASWNVNGIYDHKKLSIILEELLYEDIDIALLQETRVWYGFEEKYENYTLFFPENEVKDKRTLHGVAIAVKNVLKPYFEIKPVSSVVSDRIMHCIIHIRKTQSIHFINVYAPVNEIKPKPRHSATENDETENTHEPNTLSFYEHLENILFDVPPKDLTFLFGDFNAHIGNPSGYHKCLGDFRVPVSQNKNGRELIDFCDKSLMCIYNTFVSPKDDIHEKMTHYNKGQSTWTELDLLITKKENFEFIKEFKIKNFLVRTDHCMVVSTLAVQHQVTESEQPALNIDIAKFVFLFSNNNLTHDVALHLKNELLKFIQEVELLYNVDLNHEIKMFIKQQEKIFVTIWTIQEKTLEYKNSPSLESLSNVRSKKEDACDVILNCLNTSSKSNYSNKKEEIRQILEKVVSKRCEFNYPQSSLRVKINWTQPAMLPSSKDVDFALNTLEKSNKYIFLKQSINSLIKGIWKCGKVPKEMSYASTFSSSKEHSGINILKLMHDAIHYLLIERLTSLSHFYTEKKRIYTSSSANDMTTSLKIIQCRFRDSKLPMYMASLDFFGIQDEISTPTLLDFFKESECPHQLFHLIVYFIENVLFTGDVREKTQVSMAECLLNFYFSFILLKVFGEPEEMCRDCVDPIVRYGVRFEYEMVIITSCAKELKRCLTELNAWKNSSVGIPMRILFPKYTLHEEVEFSSLTEERNIRDKIKIHGVFFS